VKDRAHVLIAVAARDLAGKVHTQEDLHDALFTLVLECTQPERQPVVLPLRRMPACGEVLPPQQRATWARALTAFDVPAA
jgi:hypothetical protein